MSTDIPTPSPTAMRRRARKEAAAALPPYTPPIEHVLDAALGWALVHQGFSGEYAADLVRRIQAQRAEIDARYPVAEGAVTAEQKARQDAQNECALQMIKRDRDLRIMAELAS